MVTGKVMQHDIMNWTLRPFPDQLQAYGLNSVFFSANQTGLPAAISSDVPALKRCDQ